jgi:hypothetical protein
VKKGVGKSQTLLGHTVEVLTHDSLVTAQSVEDVEESR